MGTFGCPELAQLGVEPGRSDHAPGRACGALGASSGSRACWWEAAGGRPAAALFGRREAEECADDDHGSKHSPCRRPGPSAAVCEAAAIALGKADTTYYYAHMAGGHGGAADNKQRAYMWALTYAFLAEVLGL